VIFEMVSPIQYW